MANRTAKDAKSVKGTNPQYIVEKIIRMRIYDSRYWKEDCFALSAELIVDKAMEMRYVGGVYSGNIKPTPFLCLTLKMLQIQPEKDVIIEFIRQEDSKYLRALGAYYLRLTGTSVEMYKYLEPLYNDYRKLRFMDREGRFSLLHMDEFIDLLLREERVCDIQLPRLQKRDLLEDSQQLEPRISALEEDLDGLSDSSDEETKKKEKERERERNRVRDREREKQKRSSKRHEESNGRDRDRGERDRDRDRDYDRRHRKEFDDDGDRKKSHRSSKR